MEETTAEIDSRDISGDVVYQLSVCQGGSSSVGESKRTLIDSCDESASKEYASGRTTVEIMMLTNGREEL